MTTNSTLSSPTTQIYNKTQKLKHTQKSYSTRNKNKKNTISVFSSFNSCLFHMDVLGENKSSRKDKNSVNSPPSTPSTPPTKRARKDDTVPDQKNDNPKTGLVENLQIYAYVALMCVTHPENVFGSKINDVLLSVQVLHDNLVLFENEAGLLSDIALLCEEWWRRDLVGKDGLISQMLPFLLSKALTMKKKVDVKRVYRMREAFALFDFEDESIEDLKLLLIRCLISPLFLKMDEGRRFLAFLFGLSRQLVKELLAMVRSQIAFGRKSMLEAYGEIVFRGWKGVDGGLKDEIENEFLLQLVDGSIHASSGICGVVAVG